MPGNSFRASRYTMPVSADGSCVGLLFAGSQGGDSSCVSLELVTSLVPGQGQLERKLLALLQLR